MLRRFRLGNHRSFRDEQELLLVPVYAKDRDVLPVAAVYGANASGKSNLLDGLKFMADAVRNSFAQWRPGGGIPRRPFKLDPAAGGSPSIFVAEFAEGGVRYTYGFEVDDERVLSEWLYSYPERRKRVIFERVHDDVKFRGLTGGSLKLEALRGLLRPDALFLSLGAQSAVEVLLPPYRWFVDRMEFRLDGDHFDVEPRVSEFLLDNGGSRDRLLELLRAADLGISAIGLAVESSIPFGSAYGALNDARRAARHGLTSEHPHDTEKVRFRVRIRHGAAGEPFGLDEESAGTRSWLGLLPVVLRTLQEGGLLVIDEIDASLHSLLSARLVALFNDPEANVGGGQLIFTTHDATLLHPPLADEVLDRDEVWFVEKDENGASTLYPLSDFKPRREDNLERRYLSGQYGAVPHVYEEHFVDAVRGGAADGQA